MAGLARYWHFFDHSIAQLSSVAKSSIRKSQSHHGDHIASSATSKMQSRAFDLTTKLIPNANQCYRSDTERTCEPGIIALPSEPVLTWAVSVPWNGFIAHPWPRPLRGRGLSLGSITFFLVGYSPTDCISDTVCRRRNCQASMASCDYPHRPRRCRYGSGSLDRA